MGYTGRLKQWVVRRRQNGKGLYKEVVLNVILHIILDYRQTSPIDVSQSMWKACLIFQIRWIFFTGYHWIQWIFSQVTHQDALLEQQKLKLKLQQQTLLQQQLEQQIRDYQRQLADIYGTTGAPAGPLPSGTLRAPDEHMPLEEPFPTGAPYEGVASLEDSVSEGLFVAIVAMIWQQHLRDNCGIDR